MDNLNNPEMDSSPEDGGVATETAIETTSWMDGLDDDLRQNPSITKFKDPASLAKSYVTLEKMVGKDKVAMPNDKSSQEEWDLFYSRAGRPGVPENYRFPEVTLPEGFPEIPEDTVKNFKQQAFEKGLTDKQAGELYKWYMETEAQNFQQMSEQRVGQRQETEKTLRKEWGKAFDGNLELVSHVIEKYGGDDVREALNRTGAGNDPAIAKLLLSIGKNLSEDALGGKGKPFTMSPEEAEGEINRIMGDKSHPYWDKMSPEHKAAMDRMKSLYEMAYPS